MKKLLFLGAMAAMLLGTASCSNDMEPAMGDDGTVQFTIELPGNVDSRAISDGLSAEDLQVAVYKEDGTLLNDISLLGDKKVTMSNKKATVTFKLVKGLTYKFAFWAQKPGCEAYAFDAATGKVTVDYSKALANVDDGDAFSNTATLKVTGPMNETIYLYRPFAQLNYGDVMEDYAAATAAGIDFKQAQVTVKQVATEFDIMNQTTSGTTKVDVTWPAAASAIADENLNVEDVNYKWLSMCYFLVPNDESTVNTELSLLNTAGTEFNKLTVDNVPVQKNHRTNILGNLFTDDVNFNIIIDERFDQPDNIVDALGRPFVTDGKVQIGQNGEEYNTLADAIAANTNNDVIYLGTGTYDEAITIGADETVKISSAGGLTAADVIIPQQVKTEAGATLELTNVKITSNVHGGASVEAIGANTHVVLNGVETSGRRGVNAGDGAEVVITNSKINADIDDNEGAYYNRGVNIYGNGTKVTVENSSIICETHYPINYPGSANGTELIVKNSTITGWCIFNMWGDNNTVTIQDSKLFSVNYTKNPNTNAFAAFVTCADADNNTFNINDCTLNLSSLYTTPQYLMLLGGHDNVYNGENIIIKGENTNTNGYLLGLNQSGATYTFNFENVGGTWDGEEFSF